jgi:preprotein translocase subunit SecA
MVRQDLPDFVYQDELSKWKAVLKQSQKCYQTGQPILIGTGNVEKSEFLSDLFRASNIPHQVLNAKPENVTRESEIVALAGERGAVTIATNMAGRGTDIILGGNPIFKVKEILNQIFFGIKVKNSQDSSFLKLFQDLINLSIQEKESGDSKKFEMDVQNLPYSLENCSPCLRDLYNALYKQIYPIWQNENQIVKQLGGLFVLGTERHETRRIDNQLRGRSGRQGDPGSSQFFVCLDDELLKIFGGDNIRKWVDYLIEDKDVPLESNLLTKSLENAQQKVELYNYDIRKNVFQYDNILNNQRKSLFEARQEVLFEDIYNEVGLYFAEMSLDLLDQEQVEINQTRRVEMIESKFDHYASYLLQATEKKENPSLSLYSELWISHDLRIASGNFYQQGFFKNINLVVTLTLLDFYWTEHLERMSYIRETINWRSYGQQNPLLEYNLQAFKSFNAMFEQIRSSVLYYFLDNPIIY